MNRRDRVFAMLDGKPVDRAPFAFWKHMPAGCEYGEACVREHVRLFGETGVDFVKMMIDGYRDLSQGFKVRAASDWRRIRLPAVHEPFVQDQLERIDRFIDCIHDAAPVFYHSFSPLGMMRLAWGQALVDAHLSAPDSREDALWALNEITGALEDYTHAFLTRTGASGMMYTLCGAEAGGLDGALHEDFIAASDRRLLAAAGAHSRHNMIHFFGFGNTPNRVSLWREYSAAAATVNGSVDGLSFRAAAEAFPHIHCFIGGFESEPDGLLMNGTREEIAGRTRAILREADGIRIIPGAANTVPTQIPNEHLRWVGEALDGVAADSPTGTRG